MRAESEAPLAKRKRVAFLWASGGERVERNGGRSAYLVFLDHKVLVDDLHSEIFSGIYLLHESHLEMQRKKVIGEQKRRND